VVTDARKVLNAAATDEDDRVLLKVVTFARDVGGDFHTVREADTRDLPKRRVGLLGSRGVDARANAALLGA
jgi:hypothetical protein